MLHHVTCSNCKQFEKKKGLAFFSAAPLERKQKQMFLLYRVTLYHGQRAYDARRSHVVVPGLVFSGAIGDAKDKGVGYSLTEETPTTLSWSAAGCLHSQRSTAAL